jgi:isopropylmalate/homocitrate/citramalate synthase
MKDEEIYNIFDTKKILNRPAGVLITKTSGLAGIAYWINEHYRLKGDKMVDKRSPVVIAIKEWVDNEYENERQNSISDGELEMLIAKFYKDGTL